MLVLHIPMVVSVECLKYSVLRNFVNGMVQKLLTPQETTTTTTSV